MSFEESLRSALQRAWIESSTPDFEWNGYRCEYVFRTTAAPGCFQIMDDTEVIGILRFGASRVGCSWIQKPSPLELVKLRLLV